MSLERNYTARKQDYNKRLINCFETYKNIILIDADYVGSSQFQQVRLALRKDPKAEIIMGKNTMVRQVIRLLKDKMPQLEKLMIKRVGEPGFKYLRGNIGLVFTNDDPKKVRDLIHANKVQAAAKAGTIAEIDVTVPAQLTSLDPGQTSFFQVLNIPTKITKGTIEILNPVKLIKTGTKVGASEVALLAKLDIKPFHFALKCRYVFDLEGEGAIYEASVLDLGQDELLAKFTSGVSKLASISLAIGIPNQATLPHNVVNAFKKILSFSLATDYSFPVFEKLKANAANAPAASAAPAAAGGAAPAAAAKAAEPEPEEDIGFNLFD